MRVFTTLNDTKDERPTSGTAKVAVTGRPSVAVVRSAMVVDYLVLDADLLLIDLRDVVCD